MTRYIAACLLLLLSHPSRAQQWEWSQTAGGVLSDKGIDMACDQYGNLYVCGYFNQQASFGSFSSATGFGKQGFLAKIDSNGTWLWMKELDGGWDERVLGLCVDTINSFVYVTGTTWTWGPNDPILFGNLNGFNNPGAADEPFIGKFDYNGNGLWLIGCGSEGDDHGFDLATDNQGNIYLTGFLSDHYGWFGNPGYFGSIVVPMNSDSTAYVTKLNTSGVFQWVRTFEAVDGERDNRIAVDGQGNVYITGGFWGTKQFGTQIVSSNGSVDIFVIKFDSNGNQQWLRTTGSTYDDRGNSITVDYYGDVYVTGEFRDRVGFGTDSLNNNGGPTGRDIFVAKITTAGNWVWAKKAGSRKGSERGNRIVPNKQGNLLVTGDFRDTARFGSNITLTAANDSINVFVACIDTSGKWRWALEAGGALADRGNSICTDDSCNVYVTGFYRLSAFFDSANTITALGRNDIFVARISDGCWYPTIVPPPPPPTPECTLIVPNVFTPNNDNKNETFHLDTTCVTEVSLAIYNRWGREMIRLNSPLDKWDGTFQGKPASEGIYYYAGSVTLVSGEAETVKGFVTLMR